MNVSLTNLFDLSSRNQLFSLRCEKGPKKVDLPQMIGIMLEYTLNQITEIDAVPQINDYLRAHLLVERGDPGCFLGGGKFL